MPLPSLLALASALLPSLPPTPTDRDEGWRSDIDFLVETAQHVHASPARQAFSDEFLEAAGELRAAVPGLSDDQVLAGLMRLVARLGDAHSVVYGPGDDSPLTFESRRLPLQFHLFPEGLYVVGGHGEAADLVGSRVVRFGDLAAEEVLRRQSVHCGTDNAVTWAWAGPTFYVGQLLLLREVGVADDDGLVSMTLESPEGRTSSRAVTAFEVPGGHEGMLRKLRAYPGASGELPLWLRDVDTNYWIASLPEHRAVYVAFNQVRDATGEPLSAFSERVRRTLREEDARAVIVDVRHNNGGNNTLLRPLVRTLVEFEMRAPGNRIFVLTGENTFSAAQNFVNRVERWTDATFVGTPTSSRPNFVGEDNPVALPYSRVIVSLSNRYWQDSDPWDDRPWIEPDLKVEGTAADWLEGRDPVLERVLAEL